MVWGFFKKKEEVRESSYDRDKYEEEYAVTYNEKQDFSENIETSYDEDKLVDFINSEESLENIEEFKEMRVISRFAESKIPLRFFRPENSNDIHDLLHYIRDAEPVAILNITRLVSNNGVEASKAMLAKIKQTVAFRKGDVFMFDTNFMIVLPFNVKMKKYEKFPELKSSQNNVKTKDNFLDDSEFNSFLNY